MPESLVRLVSAIRAHRDDEEAFILAQKQAILQEADHEQIVNDVKAEAVLKLFYIHQLGYEIDEIALNCLQLMASDNLNYKRIGYLCAAEALKCNSDMILMATQSFISDLQSGNKFAQSIALNCLASICTRDIAEAVIDDVIRLTTHNSPQIKRKAIVCLLRILSVFPEGFQQAVDFIKRCLTDGNDAVTQTTAVMICELCVDNPTQAMSFLPVMFNMLSSANVSRHIAIKLLKLMAHLSVVEPRIRDKLVQPLSELLHSSDRAVVYEAVLTTIKVYNTSCESGSQGAALIGQTLDVIRPFLLPTAKRELKVLGLAVLENLRKVRPDFVAENRHLVYDCIEDGDPHVRLAAIKVLASLSNIDTLSQVVSKIVQAAFNSRELESLPQTELTSYRRLCASLIVDCVQRNDFGDVASGDELAQIVSTLSQQAGTCAGDLVAHMVLSAATQIPATRSALVAAVVPIIGSSHLCTDAAHSARSAELVGALTWVAGEYSYTDNSLDVHPCAILTTILHPSIAALDASNQAIAVTAAFKVAIRAVALNLASQQEIMGLFEKQLTCFRVSQHAEVAQRALETCSLFQNPQSGRYFIGDVGPAAVLENYDPEIDEVLCTPLLSTPDLQAMITPFPSEPVRQVQPAAPARAVQSNVPPKAATRHHKTQERKREEAAPMTSVSATPTPVSAFVQPAKPQPAPSQDDWLFSTSTAPAAGNKQGLQTVKSNRITIDTTQPAQPAVAAAAPAPAAAAKPAAQKAPDLFDLMGTAKPAAPTAAPTQPPQQNLLDLFGPAPAKPATVTATPAPAPQTASLLTAPPAATKPSALDIFSTAAPAPAAPAPAPKPQPSDDLKNLLGL